MYGSMYSRRRKGYNLFCEWLYCNEGGVGWELAGKQLRVRVGKIL